MSALARRVAAALLLAAGGFAAGPACAAPLQPASDDEVVETLPGGPRAELRRWQQTLAARPSDVPAALALAGEWLRRAHATGDPRFAGRALGVLQRWDDPATAPPAVLLQQAMLAQYLHDFDGAAARLETLVGREPRHAQAWLVLATVRRVQGRYDASDAACAGVERAAAALHGAACRAENLALRGQFGAARAQLGRWLQTAALDPSTRVWLLTTLAEAEERAADDPAAERAYRAALAAGGDDYVAIAYADWLLRRGRGAEALPVLAGRPASDAVLLRRALAGTQANAPGAAADVASLRERQAQAALRPGATPAHARGRALAALRLEGDATSALRFARANVERQREPADLLLLAEAASAAQDAGALAEARGLARSIGLVDRRLDGVGAAGPAVPSAGG